MRGGLSILACVSLSDGGFQTMAVLCQQINLWLSHPEIYLK